MTRKLVGRGWLSALALLVGLWLARGGDSQASAPAPLDAVLNPPTSGVTVTITDSGYVPATVTIPPGTQVNWVNRGSKVHAATSDQPLFDTGGLGPNQWNFFTFTGVGTYTYHSDPDITFVTNSDGSVTRTFNLAGTVVVDAAAKLPTPVATGTVAPAAPVAPAAATPVPNSAAVTISDTAYGPATVMITMGGSVTWTNNGNQVHTATSDVDNPFWDTGGLGNGQTATLQFNIPGTYPYHSTTDANPSGSKNFTIRGQVIVATPTGSNAPIPVITPVVLVTRSP